MGSLCHNGITAHIQQASCVGRESYSNLSSKKPSSSEYSTQSEKVTTAEVQNHSRDTSYSFGFLW